MEPNPKQNNENQLVIHDCVLMIATEGTPGVEGPYDTRHPFWPGYASGVSLGIGYDIGASGTTMAELTQMLLAIGVPMKMITPLEVSIKKTGQEAKEILQAYGLAKKTQLTQQQSLDLGCLIKINNKGKVRKYFPNSYASMHPAIIEGLTKFSVNAPALVIGWKSRNFAGLGPMFDAKMAAATTAEAQFECAIEMCNTIKQRFAGSKVYVKTANAIAGFINYVWEQTKKGVNVIIDSSPIDVEQLLDPNNKTLDVARIADAAEDGSSGTDYRSLIAASRKKEPALIKAACERIGCEMPRLSGTAMSPENIARFHKANGKKDIEIEQIQEELVRQGCYKKAGIAGEMKNVDGNIGANMTKAVQAFQIAYNTARSEKSMMEKAISANLPTDGSLSADTKKAILSSSKVVKPSPVPNPQPNPIPPAPVPSPIDSPTDILNLINMGLSGKGSIKASVGRGGENDSNDVIVIKALLNKHNYYNFTFNPATILSDIATIGASDSKLESAIARFQQANGVARPDGRVDAKGKTIAWLNANSSTPQPKPAPAPQFEMPKPIGDTNYTCYH